ncbi:Uncharacterised protein g6759 [Pycnogonum litorale]
MDGHHNQQKPSVDEEEDDPVEKLLSKSGCAKLHYEVQECMFVNKDWRKCQKEVTAFRNCVENNRKKSVVSS